jgi:AbrB family looped-hinge helix DNA binding protein
MMSRGGSDVATVEGETTVSEGCAATIPSAVREQLDLRPGDRLRWRVVDDELRVEIVYQREGAFDDLETISVDVVDGITRLNAPEIPYS